MKSLVSSLVVLVALATSLHSTPAGEIPSRPLRLLVHSNGHYELWQFDVQLDERPLVAYWDDVFRRLLEFADADGDGRIDKHESQLLPSAHGIRQTLWGRFLPTPARTAWTDLDGDGSDEISLRELARYYRRQGIGNVLVAVGFVPATGQISEALADELGLNAKVSMPEERWKAAVRTIFRLDKNGDGLISPGELVGTIRYPGASATQLLPPAAADSEHPAEFPLIVVPAAETDVDWPNLLPGQPKLAENSDDLNCAERQEWLSQLPRRNWSLHLDKDQSTPSDSSTIGERDVVLSGLSAMIHVDSSRGATAVLEQLDRYRAQFREVDSTGEGFVDAEKLKMHPQLRELPKLVRLADRNRDGRLTGDEFNRWQELQQSYVRGGVLLSVLDFGHGLFELLDENFDGSLSKPELSAGWKRLTETNVLDDHHRYSAARLPRQLRVTLSLGKPASQLRSSARNAPPWFLAIDRNKDLRLSRSEFLGSDADFARLDADGDQAISPDEASRH